MFGVDFSEMVVIAIVALVVIGPEKLPKVARTLGLLLGRAQRYVTSLRADLEREMQLDELRRIKNEVQSSATAFRNSLEDQMATLRQGVEDSLELTSANPPDAAGASHAADTSGPHAPIHGDTLGAKDERS